MVFKQSKLFYTDLTEYLPSASQQLALNSFSSPFHWQILDILCGSKQKNYRFPANQLYLEFNRVNINNYI